MAYIKVLWGCQKGDSSAADDKLLSIPNYMFIVFLRKFNLDFLQFFNVHLVLFNVHLKVQSTIESTQFIRKYINVLSNVLCTLFSFRVEKILIPTCSCTFGCTLYFQTWKYRVHPKVQSTSESTKYTTHTCFNLFLRIRLKQKRKVRPINCDVLETILTWAKISPGMYQPLPSKPLLHMHFLYECNSISTIVHTFPQVLSG